jgi:hypothetical protein
VGGRHTGEPASTGHAGLALHACWLLLLLLPPRHHSPQALDPAKFPLPEPYPHKESAAFFKEPDVLQADQLPPLKWTAPDEDALVAFLVGESCVACGGERWLLVLTASRGCAGGARCLALLVCRAPRVHHRTHISAAALCSCPGEKGFNEDRVRNQVKKINASKGKASQGRLESFFGPVTVKPNEKKAAKEAEAKAAAKAAKGKGGKGGKDGLAAKGGVKKAPIAAAKKKK